METQTIQGKVTRLIFTSRDTGFGVAQLAGSNGSAERIIVTGQISTLAEGEEISAEGSWIKHPKFGTQFKIDKFINILPSDVAAIEAYLGSGLLKGIGPMLAKRIVERFQGKAMEILDRDPGRLLEIDGIGEKKLARIIESWQSKQAVHQIMIFLSGHKISPAYATRIYKRYGMDSVRILTENPYRLAHEIDGIGFLTADKIASSIGFPADGPERIKAGTLYELIELQNREGHVYCPSDILCKKASDLLKVTPGAVMDALMQLSAADMVAIERSELGNHRVYTKYMFTAETEAAATIRQHYVMGNELRWNNIDEEISQSEERVNIQLTDEQRDAVKMACTNCVSIVTGGPGVGKSACCRVICDLFARRKMKILLAAPTGRAARRLAESCSQEAMTIHRALEYAPREGGFLRNEENPIPCDVLIVDESSMIDIVLFYNLVRALPDRARVVLIGDRDQLPSVGPGLVFNDLIESGLFPVTRLTKIFRQAAKSRIVNNAHMILQGKVPSSDDFVDDCVFINRENADDAAAEIIKLIQRHRDISHDIQIISPMKKGPVGTDNLNNMMQEAVNPIPPGKEKVYEYVSAPRRFRIGDRVICLKNDNEREIANGNIGMIRKIDHEDQVLDVDYDGRIVEYDLDDLDNLGLAYAITVHKSQGSEYPIVVIPLVSYFYIMLVRSLIYTAITRSQKQVVLIGDRKSLAIAVRNAKTKHRYSGLRERIALAP